MATKEQQRAARACRLMGEAKELSALAKAKEKEAKAIVDELLPVGEKGELASPSYGTIARTFQERLGIDPSSEERLRDVLGDEFTDYVKRSVNLKPTKKLKELLADGDSALGSGVRPHVELKISPVVKFTPAPGVKFMPQEPALI
jgi:DNA-binding SARP family transcriptional activator